jgi:hypothetical protein
MGNGYDSTKDHVHFTHPIITTTDKTKARIEVYVAHYDGADTSWRVATVRRYTDWRGKECVDGKPGRLNREDAGKYASALLVCAEFIGMNEKTKAPAPKSKIVQQIKDEEEKKATALANMAKAREKLDKEKDAAKAKVPTRGSQWGKKKTPSDDDDI